MNRSAVGGFALLAVLTLFFGAAAAVLVSGSNSERPPEVSVPPDASQVFGDFDGDDRPDRMTIARNELQWFVVTEPTGSPFSIASLPEVEPGQRPQFVGTVDGDGDGRDEVWLSADSQAIVCAVDDRRGPTVHCTASATGPPQT